MRRWLYRLLPRQVYLLTLFSGLAFVCSSAFLFAQMEGPGYRNNFPMNLSRVGEVNGRNAPKGWIGEAQSSIVDWNSSVALSTGTDTEVTEFTLGPGNWDIQGSVYVSLPTTKSWTYFAGAITQSGSVFPVATDPIDGEDYNQLVCHTGDCTGSASQFDEPYVLKLSTSIATTTLQTTLQLRTYMSFTGTGTGPFYYGYLRARRAN